MLTEPSDVKALIAALHFIFSNSTKYDVSSTVLPQELQQLGIPKDIAMAICKEFVSYKDELSAYLLTKTLSLPAVNEINWRVDWVIGSDIIKNVNAPCISLQLGLKEPLNGHKPITSVGCDLTVQQFTLLHQELKQARAIMDTIQ